jgi:hypothetical protein
VQITVIFKPIWLAGYILKDHVRFKNNSPVLDPSSAL